MLQGPPPGTPAEGPAVGVDAGLWQIVGRARAKALARPQCQPARISMRLPFCRGFLQIGYWLQHFLYYWRCARHWGFVKYRSNFQGQVWERDINK